MGKFRKEQSRRHGRGPANIIILLRISELEEANAKEYKEILGTMDGEQSTASRADIFATSISPFDQAKGCGAEHGGMPCGISVSL